MPVKAPRPRTARPASPRAPASFVAPMKALGSTTVPLGTWHCEIKYDGYRAVAVLNAGTCELWSRNRKAMTAAYPGIVDELEKLPCRNAVLDGEIVALDADGRSRFQLLQNGGEKAKAVLYYVFDIMHLDGKSMVGETLEERAVCVARVLGKAGRRVKASLVFNVEPSRLFEAARRNGLEGIIAKRLGSRYEPDRRSGAWLKCKVLAEQEFVVGGFTEPQNSRQHFGAILVGYYAKNRLMYAGKVGTAFDGAALETLHGKFMGARAAQCPFANLPFDRRARFGTGMGAAEMSRVTWIRPTFVAQVKFAEWTDEGLLRQPVFLGLRADKPAREVRREPGPSIAKPKRF